MIVREFNSAFRPMIARGKSGLPDSARKVPVLSQRAPIEVRFRRPVDNNN
jgi:hypothetical protein